MLVSRFLIWYVSWDFALNYAAEMVVAIDDERKSLGIPSIFD